MRGALRRLWSEERGGGRSAIVGTMVAATILIGGYAVTQGGGGDCQFPDCFPDETNTGVPDGTSLTTHSGNLTTSSNGQVIDEMDVTGCIVVNHHSVHITNTEAKCIQTIDGPAETLTNPPLLIEDSTVDCEYEEGTGVFEQNIELHRVHIIHCENGLSMDEGLLIEDSLINDQKQCATSNCVEPDAHTDGLQSPIAVDFVIRHNTFRDWNDFAWDGGGYTCPNFSDGRCNGTSALNINNCSDPPGPCFEAHDVLVEENLLGGGANTLYCPAEPTFNFTVQNNHFEDDTFFGAYMEDCQDDETVTGNVEHTSGDPVNP